MIFQSTITPNNILSSKLSFDGAYPTYEDFKIAMEKYGDTLEFTRSRYQILYDELGADTFLLTNNLNKLNAFLYRNWIAEAKIARKRQELYDKNLDELLEKEADQEMRHYDIGENENAGVDNDFLTMRTFNTARGKNQMVGNIDFHYKLLSDPELTFINNIKKLIVATVQPTRKIIIKGVPYYE